MHLYMAGSTRGTLCGQLWADLNYTPESLENHTREPREPQQSAVQDAVVVQCQQHHNDLVLHL